MRFSEARKREVVATGTASSVGRIEGFVVDPNARAIVALRIGKADGDTLAWSDVTSFGVDAVTIADAGLVRAAHDGPEREQPNLPGHRVLDEHGVEHGQVRDVEFDPQTGQVRSILASDAEIDGSRLIGVGSWAVIVSV